MIKNWTVTTQAVKNGLDGLITRERYITSATHPNHKKTERIINIIGSKETTIKMMMAGENFKLKQKTSGKGGRPLASYAMEFCLTLPKGMRPSPEQWKNIVRDVAIALAKKIKLSKNEFQDYTKLIRAVLHQQPQNEKKGSGDHIHLIVGKVINNKVFNELQKKEATSTIKQAFNSAVLNHYGIDYRDYTPKELNRGKKLEVWRHTIKIAEESVECYNLILKIQKQAETWFDAFNKKEKIKANRTFNRLNKNIALLDTFETSNNLKENINKLRNKIESTSGVKFKR